MDCAAAKQRLSPLIDDALGADDADAVRAHVRFCAGCASALEGLRGVGRVLQALPRAPLPAGFRERLARRREQEGSPALPASLYGLRPLPAAAALACVLLVALVVKTRHPAEESLAAAARSDDALRARLRRDPPLPAPPAASPSVQPLARETAPAAPAGFDNDAQQALLAQDRAKMGIRTLDAREAQPPMEPQFQGHIGAPENRAAVDAMVQEMAAASREIRDASQLPEVPLAGRTVPVLAKGEDGGRAAEGAAVDRWEGEFSSAPEGTRTVFDEASWRALWPQISSEPVPPVDFQRQQIVAVFLGPRPTHGYSVSILGATATPTALIVQYVVREPVPGTPAADGATAPFALRAVPRTDLPVRYQKVK